MSDLNFDVATDLWQQFGPELFRYLVSHYKNNKSLGQAIYHNAQINYNFAPKIEFNLGDHEMIYELNRSINWDSVALIIRGKVHSYKHVTEN